MYQKLLKMKRRILIIDDRFNEIWREQLEKHKMNHKHKMDTQINS